MSQPEVILFVVVVKGVAVIEAAAVPEPGSTIGHGAVVAADAAEAVLLVNAVVATPNRVLDQDIQSRLVKGVYF